MTEPEQQQSTSRTSLDQAIKEARQEPALAGSTHASHPDPSSDLDFATTARIAKALGVSLDDLNEKLSAAEAPADTMPAKNTATKDQALAARVSALEKELHAGTGTQAASPPRSQVQTQTQPQAQPQNGNPERQNDQQDDIQLINRDNGWAPSVPRNAVIHSEDAAAHERHAAHETPASDQAHADRAAAQKPSQDHDAQSPQEPDLPARVKYLEDALGHARANRMGDPDMEAKAQTFRDMPVLDALELLFQRLGPDFLQPGLPMTEATPLADQIARLRNTLAALEQRVPQAPQNLAG